MVSVQLSMQDRERLLMEQPVPVLRAHAEEHNVSLSNCLEKSEMVQRILNSEAYPVPQPRHAGRVNGQSAGYPSLQGDEQFAREVAAEDAQRQAVDLLRDRAARMGRTSSGTMNIAIVQTARPPANGNDLSPLHTLAQNGVAVDLGSRFQQARQAEQQHQQMQAAQASRDLAESQRLAYDYGRPTHSVQQIQMDLRRQDVNERPRPSRHQAAQDAQPWVQQAAMPAQSTQGMMPSQHVAYDYGSPYHFAHHPQTEHSSETYHGRHHGSTQGGAQSGRVRRNMAVNPYTGVPIGAPGQAGFFDSMAAAMAGGVVIIPQNPMDFFYIPHMDIDAEPAAQGADATTINATTSTMIFPGTATDATGSVASTTSTKAGTLSAGGTSSMSATNTGGASADPIATNTEDASCNAQMQCSVCMEPFHAGEELRILPCLHKYHTCCIDEWLSRNPACPICKHPLVSG